MAYFWASAIFYAPVISLAKHNDLVIRCSYTLIIISLINFPSASIIWLFKCFIIIILQIEVRKCVVYNEAIGRYGAWDGDKCTTVMSEQVSTVCECYTDGTFGNFNFLFIITRANNTLEIFINTDS